MPQYRSPMSALMSFANQRDSDATGLGDIISQIARPILGGMGVQTADETTPTLVGGERIDLNTIEDPLFRSVVQQESGGRTQAVSPKGASGPAQVMPSTARDPGYGIKNIFDRAAEQGVQFSGRTNAEAQRLLLEHPQLGIELGQDYLNEMLVQTGGNAKLATSAYNAGLQRVIDAGYNVPNIPETQNYVRNVMAGANMDSAVGGGMDNVSGGPGADTLGTGGLPQNIEDILAQLYPQSGEDDARRRDKNLALSKIFSSLSTGAPMDVSSVAATADARRRQAVLDLREKERARGAAALVFKQTNDSELASAIARGSIQYSDVVSYRDRKRIEDEADKARLKTEQATGRLASIFGGMDPADLGLNDEQFKTALEGIKAGDDPSTFLTLGQTALVAEKTRDVAAKRDATITALEASNNPQDQRAAMLMDADPNMSAKEALTLANDKEFAPSPEAKLANEMVDAGMIDPKTGQPYTLADALKFAIANSKTPSNQSGVNLTINPDGSVSVNSNPVQSATTGAPPPSSGLTFGADVPPVSVQGVPTSSESTGSSNAVVEVGKPSSDSVLTLQNGQFMTKVAPGSQTAQEMQIAAAQAERDAALAPGDMVKQELANELSALAAEQTQLELDATRRKIADDADKKRQVSSGTVDQAVKDIELVVSALDALDSETATGVIGGVLRTLGDTLGIGTPQSELYASLKSLVSSGALDRLSKLETPLTPVSDADLALVQSVLSLLGSPEKLTPETMRTELARYGNLIQELTFGASEPMRFDKNGNPYETTARTLGMSDDRFAANWKMLPADVRQQWVNGEIAEFPTGEGVTYNNASQFFNDQITEFEAYRGAITDRSVVGAAETAETAAGPSVTIDGEAVTMTPDFVTTMTEDQYNALSDADKKEAMAYLQTLKGNQDGR